MLATILTTTATPPPPPSYAVSFNFSTTTRTTSTAATVEVDVMPFLGRTSSGGPFGAYYEALSGLGAEYVRFSPWFPNPRVVVTELTPPNCNATHPATNWDSAAFDEVMSDFYSAVCGPGAADGACERSVVQQLSSMPSWLFVDGYDYTKLPADPWDTPDPFDVYTAGGALKDPSCEEMARYFARLAGWYTAGGFHDECGHWHASGLRYAWYGLSILNEDEHHLQPDGGPAYTTCYDAVKAAVAKVNPQIVPAGPEWAVPAVDVLGYFLNASNHADGAPPPLVTYHWASSHDAATAETFFTAWDGALKDNVDPIGALVDPARTQLGLNEFIPFVKDYYDCKGVPADVCSEAADVYSGWMDPRFAQGDPDLQHARGIGINRTTVSWNAAASLFAYAFGTLAERGYLFVGQDQLIGGTWPDNEPAVSMLDWQSGEPNAKYWVTRLLAAGVGSRASKRLSPSNSSDPSALYALAFTATAPPHARSLLLVNKRQAPATATLAGVTGGEASCVEVGAGLSEPGFAPTVVKRLSSAGVLAMGGFATCVVSSLQLDGGGVLVEQLDVEVV